MFLDAMTDTLVRRRFRELMAERAAAGGRRRRAHEHRRRPPARGLRRPPRGAGQL